MSALPRRALTKSPLRRGDDALPTSHLGKALSVKGNLETEGELHIHGRVFGQIRANRLIVAPGGYVEGDVLAWEVRIGGFLNGRVFAFNVTLDSTADMTGRIFHHIIAVERGARVDGRMPWRPLNFFETLEQIPEAQS
ncbi:MAG TPA: polymer-forming cytoskeletal protein [Rhizomicrobium sp.]|jgi:cytoskeletal protein CcmA (bactofilin family)